MASTPFARCFGPALAGSALSASRIGLGDNAEFNTPAFAACSGVFKCGLLSVCSTRENGGELGAWAAYLPPGARLFASSAFGCLFAHTDQGLWVVDPHYGQVVESDLQLPELFELLCEPEVREEYLRESLFLQWQALNAGALLAEWLCPTPAIALAGQWTVATLRPMAPALLLSFTAQLFGPGADQAVEVRRLGPA